MTRTKLFLTATVAALALAVTGATAGASPDSAASANPAAGVVPPLSLPVQATTVICNPAWGNVTIPICI